MDKSQTRSKVDTSRAIIFAFPESASQGDFQTRIFKQTTFDLDMLTIHLLDRNRRVWIYQAKPGL